MYVASNGSTTLTVNRRTTGTTVSCTPRAGERGPAATCTATVTDTDAGTRSTPTGTVSWTTDGNGSFASATCTLVAVNGSTARCQVLYTANINGPHTLTASYSGSATTHAPSSGSGDLAVVYGTVTTISCVPSPDIINGPTICRATVIGDGISTPSGTVTWSTDTVRAVSSTRPRAHLTPPACAPSSTRPTASAHGNINTLTASYSGDFRYLASSGTRALTINRRGVCHRDVQPQSGRRR